MSPNFASNTKRIEANSCTSIPPKIIYSEGIKVNEFASIRLILKAKFGDNSLQITPTKNTLLSIPQSYTWKMQYYLKFFVELIQTAENSELNATVSP